MQCGYMVPNSQKPCSCDSGVWTQNKGLESGKVQNPCLVQDAVDRLLGVVIVHHALIAFAKLVFARLRPRIT